MLELEGISFRYGARPVLREITSTIAGPQIVALIGPNGAGKSTLINVIAGRLSPSAGTCRMLGESIAAMTPAQLSLRAAHVPQQGIEPVAFTVEEVVLTGRTPHGKGLFESKEDLAALETALDVSGLAAFRKRRFSSLSGGEQQRVLVAAAVAQASPIILLDEPGAHLDPANQTELWDLLARLRDQGHLVLIVTHHLHLAARRSDRVWLMSEGLLVADGPPCDAMQTAQLETVFHVPFEWHTNAEGRTFLNYG